MAVCCNQEMQIGSQGSCHIHENAGAVGVCMQTDVQEHLDGGVIGVHPPRAGGQSEQQF